MLNHKEKKQASEYTFADDADDNGKKWENRGNPMIHHDQNMYLHFFGFAKATD